MHDGNVAFKVTWVYGKKGPFTTPCTSEGRDINIRLAKKPWCSSEGCPCNERWREERTRGVILPPVDQVVCYDAGIFKEECFGGGYFHHGPKTGQPIMIRHAKPGRMAFLTTKNHEMDEADRIVIACYQIREVEFEPENWGCRLLSWPKSFVRIKDFSKAPRYWKFREQAAGPIWGTGLFRYVTDAEAEALKAAVLEAAG